MSSAFFGRGRITGDGMKRLFSSLLVLSLSEINCLRAEPILLKNQAIVVTVDSDLGRITEFRSLRGSNLMHIRDPRFDLPKKMQNDYVMRGGERLCPTQTLVWRYLAPNPAVSGSYNFLPDEAIDGQPWRLVSASARSVTLESSQSQWLGLIARRTLTLHDSKPILKINTTLERVARSPIPVQVWSISIIQNPEFCLLGIDEEFRGSPFAWTELSKPGRLQRNAVRDLGDALAFTPPEEPDSSKVGSMGSWIAAIYPKEIFLQVVEFAPNEAYPDNSSVQAYAGTGYFEIETLSPNQFLKVGQKLQSRVIWKLLARPTGPLNRFIAGKVSELSGESEDLRESR